MIEGLDIQKAKILDSIWYVGWEGRLIGTIKRLDQYGIPTKFYSIMELKTNYVLATFGGHSNLFESLEDAAETLLIVKLAQ